MPPDLLETTERLLAQRLLARRSGPGHWEGHLASSALSTATAVLALHLHDHDHHHHHHQISSGTKWLVAHQHADGGWGDTVRSKSNISTTAIVWAVLSAAAGDAAAATARARAWLDRAAGDGTAEGLRGAILRRYGQDRTFSVPILTLLALAEGTRPAPTAAWRAVPQLPFELAALPHGWFQHLSLPVVSYALPALIAIGQVRHHFAPSRNPVTRFLRQRVLRRTLRVLREMQPASGGYLEATPLTSFVVMSLAGLGNERTSVGRGVSPAKPPDGETEPPPHASRVIEAGVRFLTDSMREDGSWPIDTNLSTWVTTLSLSALGAADALSADTVEAAREWLLAQQSDREHPFTHAKPGAWAWTPLSGGVPDADDTAGALLALARLGTGDPRSQAAASRGVRWLLDVQNRDGGIPTFCRGWGTLPFDQSTPELTSHALQAWGAWMPHLATGLQADVGRATARALRFIASSQRPDGTWIPLWFGNEHTHDEENPTYGTARVLVGLQKTLVRDDARAMASHRRGVSWLMSAQNADGGWGGVHGAPSSLEETGVVLAALAGTSSVDPDAQILSALERGAAWIADAVERGVEAAPIGLYFARLWYYEDLYPLAFALSGLAAARRVLAASGR